MILPKTTKIIYTNFSDKKCDHMKLKSTTSVVMKRAFLIPISSLGVFYQNCLKIAPTKSKVN
jgi:hypothetical protein